MFFRRAFAGFLALLLTLGGLLALPPARAEALSDQEYQTAARLLNKYRLVVGDDRGYRFRDPITRAEVAKLLVYSLGYESQVNSYFGRRDFKDTEGHWAEGIIAVARDLGVMQGYPGGEFRPQSPVSYAEMVTALSRLVGLEPSTAAWPRTYIGPARQIGIIPPEMPVEQVLQNQAIRGDVFVMLKRALADVQNYEGETLLQRYLDKTPPSLTIDPQPQETKYNRLTITGAVKDAALVKVNGTSIEILDGYFQSEVSLRVGPNTIRVQAFDDAGNMRQEVVQISRIEGAPNEVALSGPATVTAGGTAPFSLIVRDNNGEELRDRSSVGAEVRPEIGKFDPVTGLFVAGTKAGTGTITVRMGAVQTSTNVTVVAAPVDRIEVKPGEAVLDAGQVTAFSVVGYDAYGNEVPVSGAQWSATGGTIQSTGFYQAPATTAALTVTATVGGKQATATVRPPNHQVARVTMAQPSATLRAYSPTEMSITATVVDESGRTVKDYSGMLTVTSSAPFTAYPSQANVPVVNGVATIPIRSGSTPGTARITVSTNLGKSGIATVTVEPQRLQSVRLSGYPVTSSDGTPQGVIEAVALDTEGNPMRTPLTQTLVIGLKLPTPSGVTVPPAFISNNQQEADIALGSLDSATGEVRVQTRIRYTAGSGTMLITGTAKPAAMAWVQVMAGTINAGQVGTPTRLTFEPIVEAVAGQTRSIYVNIVDADGYRVTQPGPLTGLVVSLRDQDGTVWPASPPNPSEPGRLRFDVVHTKSGTFTYTATLQPAGSSASASSRVVPGPVYKVVLTADRTTLQADNASQSTLRAELLDQYDNRITSPSYPITFRRLEDFGVTQPFPERVVNTINGIAEVRVTAARVVATERFEASLDRPEILPANRRAEVPITTVGAPVRLRLGYGDNNGNGTPNEPADANGTAGIPHTITVEVLDNADSVVTSDKGRQILLTVRDMSTGQENTQTATTVEGAATFYVRRSDAHIFAVKAEASGLIKALSFGYGGTVADMELGPSISTAIRVAPDLTVIQADNGKSFALVRAQLVDPNGNPAPNQTGAPVSVTLTMNRTDYTYGYFTLDDTKDGFKSLTRTVVIPVGEPESDPIPFFSGNSGYYGSTQITGRATDGATASATISTRAWTTVARFQIDMPQAGRISTNTPQVVTVTAVDANGNRVTNYSGPSGQIAIASTDDDVTFQDYWDEETQSWIPLGSPNQVGEYETVKAVDADRGQVIFRVSATEEGTKRYDVGPGSVPLATSRPPRQTGFGQFDP